MVAFELALELAEGLDWKMEPGKDFQMEAHWAPAKELAWSGSLTERLCSSKKVSKQGATPSDRRSR